MDVNNKEVKNIKEKNVYRDNKEEVILNNRDNDINIRNEEVPT